MYIYKKEEKKLLLRANKDLPSKDAVKLVSFTSLKSNIKMIIVEIVSVS